MSSISLIVAAAENGVIGLDGDMPWRLPDDLKRFRRITMGHPVVMGRKTYETIGRALPGRRSIVVSRQEGYLADGCEVVGSLEAALLSATSGDDGRDEVFVMGGGALYAAALPSARRIYLTRVHARPEGDTWFRFDVDAWVEVDRERHEADERNSCAYSYVTLERRPV